MSRLARVGAKLVLVHQILVQTPVDLHHHLFILTQAGDYVVGFINVFAVPGELTANYST